MAKLPFLCPLKLLPDVFPDACLRYLPDAPDAEALQLLGVQELVNSVPYGHENLRVLRAYCA